MADREYKRFAGQSVANAGYHNHNWDLFQNGNELRDVSFASLSAAITAIGTSSKTLYITTQHRITSNTTTPSNISIQVLKGGSFAISSGVTLTIQGSFEAGNFTVFTGLGTVVFGSGAVQIFNVMWWGSMPIPAYNSTSGFQAATDAAYAAGGGAVYAPKGSYLVTSITRNWAAAISIRFVGAGMHATKIEKFDSSTSPFFDLSADLSILSTYSSIEEMWISGNTSLYNCPGVRLTQVANFIMRNVEINYCSIGVDSVGSLVNDFYGVKWHLNITGFKARKSANVYSNANNFYGCIWTGNRFQGVDYGEGSGVRFYGGDVEANGTEPLSFTVNAGTNLVTLSDNIIIQSGVAVQVAAVTSLPTATMATSTFTADSVTDKITLTTDLGLPTGYPCTVASTLTLPTGLLAATTYYLILVSAGIYKLATSRDNALAGTAIDLTTNGTGTLTLTPTGLVAENDYWWSRVSANTGYLCSSYANAIAGTSIDLTSTGVGTLTVSFVGTGGILFRDSMDQETAGPGAADVRDPGIAHANLSGVHFESNNGRALASENSRGLNLSVADCVFLNTQQSNGGRSLYILGCKKLTVSNITCGGAGDNVGFGSGCNTTNVIDSVLYNFTDNSPYPTHYNVIDSAGASFPGYSTHTRWYKSKLAYFHVGVTESAHTIGNGGTNRLTYTATNSAGHLFAGGAVEMQSVDAADLDLTDRLDIISPASGGPTLALESTDTGGRRYVMASGGSANGAFKTGRFTLRDSNANDTAWDYDPNRGFWVNNRFQGKKSADIAAANDITLGVGNFTVITGANTINRITTTDWDAGSEITLMFASTPTVAHQGAATAGALARINLNGSVNFVATANSRMKLYYDGTDWWEISRTLP